MAEQCEAEECKDAYQNPKCPYVTMINQHSSDIHQIKNALVGDDLQSGLVAEVQQLKLYMRLFAATAGVAIPLAAALALKLLGVY